MSSSDLAPLVERVDIQSLSYEDWRLRLLQSIDHPVVMGRRYPGFPDEGTQRAYVGSAAQDTINEAFGFYRYLRDHIDRRRFRVPSTRYLDFGCGWGRISRIFLHDFERGDISGVDIDDGMVEFCQQTGAPGGYFSIRNGSKLPFGDAAFQLVTAYSVFSHLPESLFQAWLHELLRVTAPGGLIAFTVEPERFLDFVHTIDPSNASSGWHAALFEHLGDIEARRTELRRHGSTFLPTGGGPYRPPETYGDMVVTRAFVERCVGSNGQVLAFLDDPQKFWQAVVVVRRNRWALPFKRSRS